MHYNRSITTDLESDGEYVAANSAASCWPSLPRQITITFWMWAQIWPDSNEEGGSHLACQNRVRTWPMDCVHCNSVSYSYKALTRYNMAISNQEDWNMPNALCSWHQKIDSFWTPGSQLDLKSGLNRGTQMWTIKRRLEFSQGLCVRQA